jgi:membrane dipeptidase
MTAALSWSGTRPEASPATQAQPQVPTDEAALIAKARGIHSRVITLDTHNDIEPGNFTPECNYTMRLTTQVNIPKMKEGGMDVSFMIAYVGQGALTPEGYDSAYRQAVAKFDAVHRLTEQIAPNEIGLALTPADVVRLHGQGKKIAVIGIENGYQVGLDLNHVKEFFDRGGRYMSLAHNGHSQLSDSNTGEANDSWMWGGLSPLGKQVIAEMNRLGMMVDVSHPSKGSMMQAVALSKAPIIASHSGIRALANVSRNLDDEQLIAIKQNGGVVQVVAFASYVKTDPNAPDRNAEMALLRERFGVANAGGGRGGGRGAASAPTAGAGATASQGQRAGAAPPATGAAVNQGAGGGRGAAAGTPRPCSVEQPGAAAGRGGRGGGGRGAGGGANAALDALTPEQRAEYDRGVARINAKYPGAGARATVSDFVNHIDYAVKLIGVDHVGISSDFDGGGGVDGWNSAAEAFNVTLELVRRGYTEEQIGKIWSGNLLRVWGDVEKVAKSATSK